MRIFRLLLFVSLAAALSLGTGRGLAQTPSGPAGRTQGKTLAQRKVSQAQREAAAAARAAAGFQVLRADGMLPQTAGIKSKQAILDAFAMPMPGDTPDYFGVANWAFSPPLRKFVDGLPGLGEENVNNLGQYLPVAVPDEVTYPGSDYYEIELREYSEQMHSDLPPTRLRGYVQVKNGEDVAPIHYLGPIIIAEKNRPVRIKFTNQLPTGEEGNLFIPVDTTVMGAGMGPLGMDAMPMNYTQNRATIHLHGGRTPWISDGTPHQWIVPAEEETPYRRGVSAVNVPDMPDPGDGAMTFYWTNQQSARLMFYHDHAYGITRLNVYVGEAAGYLITDQAERDLLAAGLIPAEQIPLIIQEKTFVDAAAVRTTDPNWNWGTGALDPVTGIRAPHTGDLWLPHVYVPAQNPYDVGGVNPFGRWHYGPWFWPPTTNITHGPVANPYYDPANAPWEPPMMPGVPHPSMGMEAFFDTPVVNGTAFPTLTVQPKAYRFRILNAANDRFWNLQLYVADPAVIASDGRTLTEVKMVPAVATAGFPETWPTDGRAEGVPDPAMVGPSFIQIATEGGFLPAPALIPNQPIAWNMDQTTFNFGNVQDHALLLGPAERADVIIDFSAYAGQTLILYNDAPAAFPARDPRLDYYTGAPDMTDTGGHWGPQVGFGPNTRTIMQIKVAAAAPAAPFNMTALEDAFKSTAQAQGVFARSQDPIIVGQTAYNSTYNMTFPMTRPTWGYVNIQDNAMSFMTLAGTTVTLPLEPKAIQDEMGEAYEKEYGRMSGNLGLEKPATVAGNQNFALYPFMGPPTEIVNASVAATPIGALGDGTQIWKITHNGVDTHPIHFHLTDVQLINRVGWDGAIRLPDPNELGWKDTVRVSPLEDTIVAMRPILPTAPFQLPNSVRLLDPTMPEGAVLQGAGPGVFLDPIGEPVSPVINHLVNYGFEYMYHCHILSHEEMDMMRPLVIVAAPEAPSGLVAADEGAKVTLAWTDNSLNETEFDIQRAADPSFTTELATFKVGAGVTTYADDTVQNGQTYYYRVFASNVAGDTTVYDQTPDSIGFPNKRADSAFSNTVVPGVPVAPSSPVMQSAVAGNAQATVDFGAPVFDGGSPITSYTVTSAPGGITAVGTASPITVTGLTNGQAYTFTVTATNAIGTSPPSAPSNAVTPATVPDAPTAVTGMAGNKQATVTFTAPAFDGGSPILSYTATSSPDGKTATGASTTLTVNGLTNGQVYTFTVTATNAVGTGPPSTPSAPVAMPVNLTTAPTLIGPKGQQPAVPNPMAFRWLAVATASGYDIDIWKDKTYSAAGTTWTCPTAFNAGQLIWWRVRATNALGLGPWSAWASFTVQPVVIGVPAPTAPTGNQPTNPNPPQFTWTAANNATAYDVDVWQDQVYASAGAGTTWTRGTAFNAGQLIWWRVRGRNGVNVGAWSAWASFTVQPLAIGVPTPTAPTGNVATNPNPPQFTWTAAANATAYDIDVWQDQVYASAGAGTTWTRGTAFNAGQLIWWRVRGRSNGSVGAWSAWASFTVQPVVIGVPAPTGPAGAQPAAPNPMAFTWTAANNATSYDIDVWQDQVYANATAGTTWTRPTPFAQGPALWWRVRGRNGGSVGAWSAWQQFWVMAP